MRDGRTSVLNVIGAGFSRTGTLSLKLALEAVGRCYHMSEVFLGATPPSRTETLAEGARLASLGRVRAE